MEKVILHCDLNNFFASVEMLLNPALEGKAVAVCGDPKKRHGIVLAKNNLAKKFGVKTAETIWEAQKKCPDLVLVLPTYDKYVHYSKLVREIYGDYTDRIESFGIDECWLDVTASVKLLGSGKEIADLIRQRVKNQLGLTLSVGVSFTKIFAKLGSDYKKPDATTVINRENYRSILWPLSVSEMLMIGRNTERKLNSFNIHSIGDLANADKKMLKSHFGIIADKLINAANGIENEEVALAENKHVPKSVGHGTTTKRDIIGIEDAKPVIYALAEMVGTRLRRYGLIAGGVSVSVRDRNLDSFVRQTLLSFSTSCAEVIAEEAVKLLNASYNFSVPVRTLSVYTYKLQSADDAIQLSIFDTECQKHDRLAASIDEIREKYGYHTVQRALLLNNDLLGGELHDDDGFLPFNKN